MFNQIRLDRPNVARFISGMTSQSKDLKLSVARRSIANINQNSAESEFKHIYLNTWITPTQVDIPLFYFKLITLILSSLM